MSEPLANHLHPLYLNGRWVTSDRAVQVVNPATGEPLARVATIDADGVRQAITDAHAAWPAWRKLSGRSRGGYLRKIADLLESRGERLARTITQENGKPLAQSRGEVAMAVDHLRWYAEEAP